MNCSFHNSTKSSVKSRLLDSMSLVLNHSLKTTKPRRRRDTGPGCVRDGVLMHSRASRELHKSMAAQVLESTSSDVLFRGWETERDAGQEPEEKTGGGRTFLCFGSPPTKDTQGHFTCQENTKKPGHLTSNGESDNVCLSAWKTQPGGCCYTTWWRRVTWSRQEAIKLGADPLNVQW